MTPDEWARWALLGDPYLDVPIPLRELHRRLVLALEGHRDGRAPEAAAPRPADPSRDPH